MAIHHFEPSQFYSTIGSHEPVLRIADGDTVVTVSVDASGLNAEGQRVTLGGNPMTGPFYVENAEPGDSLAVHFDRLSPNREDAWSGTVLAENAVDPELVRELPGRERARWRIDRGRRTATLLEPRTGPGQTEFRLEPMLGCFGVAPEDGQAISTVTSGPHGGNMDYRGFGEGATVYLPVFVPGALFYFGDGHALQGDGEVAGTGIEVSFDVQFTAQLRKCRRIDWPRGENNEFIFTVGNARPLDQALQHATTEMYRWLTRDYGLDARQAGILIGQRVRYDVGNVFDPAYTMVCKIAKNLLPAGGSS